MTDNRLQILISSVNKNPEELLKVMNLESDGVLVNHLYGLYCLYAAADSAERTGLVGSASKMLLERGVNDVVYQ